MATLTLRGGPAADTLLGGDESELIEGAGGNDWLRGGRGENTLLGGDGQDTLTGDFGAIDRLEGGTGDDWVTTDGGGTLLGGEGRDTLQSYRDDGLPDLLDGGAGDDLLNASSAGSRLLGGDGNDVLDHTGLAVTLDGGAGNDTLVGGGDGARLQGGDGDDELRARNPLPWLPPGSPAGNLTLVGGAGNDHYVAEWPAAAHIVEAAGEGQDTVSFGFIAGLRIDPIPNVEVLRVGIGQPYDTNPAPMLLMGDAAANHLIAAGARVVVEGGAGNDRLVAESGFVTLRGGEGNDTLDGRQAGGPVLYEGGDGDDLVQVGSSGGRLFGGAGNDTLDASNSFSGTLVGGSGDDVLRGGTGVLLLGGPGADTLVGNNSVLRIDDPNDVIESPFSFNTAEVALSGWWADPRIFGAVRTVDEALPVGYWLTSLIGEPPLPVGRGGELTFALPASTDVEGFTSFGPGDRAAVLAAFALWSAGTQLRVREVVLDGPAEPGEVDIAFGFGDLSEAGVAGVTVPLPELGLTVVVIDLRAAGGALTSDAVWNTVLLHEVGHALGLKHPGNYNAIGELPRPPFLPAAEDSTRFTVMSYQEPVPRSSSDFVTTLPVLDRAVMRLLYGQAAGFASGDTRWAFDGAPGAARWIEDSDGIDTLDASGFALGNASGVTLDLRVGGRSFAGTGSGPPLVTSAGQWIVGQGSVLEHATGGPGADRLQGNEGANVLVGGAGADTLSGAPGDDTLDGGAGDDRLVEMSGANRVTGAEGDDVFVFTVRDGADPLQITTLSGGAGTDRLELRIPAASLDEATVDRLVALREQLGAAGSAAPWQLQLEGIESVSFRDSAGQPLPNQAPRARDTSARTDEDTPLSGRLPAAFDFEGDLLGYGLLSGPPGLELLPDGRYTYTPPPGWSGVAEFSYRVSDGTGATAARLTIDVTLVDDAPVLRRTPSDVDAVVGVRLSTNLAFFDIRDEDTPSLTYSLRRADGLPLPAWLSFDPATFALQGTPGPGDTGVLRLELVGRDTTNAVGAPFLLGVHAVPNRDPEAPLALPAVEDQVFNGRLPATDADGDVLRYELLSALGATSAVELSADGTLRLTPMANFWGVDTFLVRVSDGRGGSAEYFARVDFAPVDDAPVDQLTLQGEAKVGTWLRVGGGLYDPDGVYALGPGRWLRGDTVVEEVRGNVYDVRYLVTPVDVGAVLRYEVAATDPLGNPVRGSVGPAAAVQPMGQLSGSAAADRLVGGSGTWDRASRVAGGAGDDTLVSAFYFDRLEGGEGNDVLAMQLGGGLLDGGPGYDTAVINQALWRRIDLKAGVATDAPVIFGENTPPELTLTGIEAVSGSWGNEHFIGLDGPANTWGEAFRPVGGRDTMDGGTGIDTVEISGRRGDSQLVHDGEVLRVVTNRFGALDTVDLTGVERLRFDDQMLAFGARAIEVARVAFVLWSKDIAGSRDLFALGISFHDFGGSYASLIAVAVDFFAGDSDQRFADRLAGNVASGKSAAELLALMRANGGSGPGQAGRTYATQLVADHANNLHNIELAGFITGGIACSLVVDGHALFPPMGSLVGG